jgi:hypothetical protein
MEAGVVIGIEFSKVQVKGLYYTFQKSEVPLQFNRQVSVHGMFNECINIFVFRRAKKCP